MAVRKKNTKEVPASGGRALKGVLAVAAVGILAGAIYLVINPTEPKAPVHVASVREERQTILDEKIPKSGPASQPPAHGNVAPPKIPAPVFIAPSSGGDKPVAAPVSIADSTLKIGDPSKADPVELALHPSHFADPTKLVSKIGIVSIPLEGEPQNSALSPQHSALPPDSYAEAVRLEKARAFTMSMCQGLDGRIWIGSENTQPGDGTGGVQVWDPSKPPLESFTQFLSNESAARTRSVSKDARVHGGLGDDNGYAVACDLQGRIWVGHLNHGVSVFNGERWQNYEVVAPWYLAMSIKNVAGVYSLDATYAPDNVLAAGTIPNFTASLGATTLPAITVGGATQGVAHPGSAAVTLTVAGTNLDAGTTGTRLIYLIREWSAPNPNPNAPQDFRQIIPVTINAGGVSGTAWSCQFDVPAGAPTGDYNVMVFIGDMSFECTNVVSITAP